MLDACLRIFTAKIRCRFEPWLTPNVFHPCGASKAVQIDSSRSSSPCKSRSQCLRISLFRLIVVFSFHPYSCSVMVQGYGDAPEFPFSTIFDFLIAISWSQGAGIALRCSWVQYTLAFRLAGPRRRKYDARDGADWPGQQRGKGSGGS